MDSSIVVNIVLFLVSGFIALTFLRAMYPLYESLVVQREKTKAKLESIRDGTWVEMPTTKKIGFKELIMNFIKKDSKKDLSES